MAQHDPDVEGIRTDLAATTHEIMMLRRAVDEIETTLELQAAEDARVLELQAAEEARVLELQAAEDARVLAARAAQESRNLEIEQWRIERRNARRGARVAAELSKPRSSWSRLLLPGDIVREALTASQLPAHPHQETRSTTDSEPADG